MRGKEVITDVVLLSQTEANYMKEISLSLSTDATDGQREPDEGGEENTHKKSKCRRRETETDGQKEKASSLFFFITKYK